MEATFIYPNQLFDPHPALARDRLIIILEDPLFFGDYKFPIPFNKKKILLHYISMEYYLRKLVSYDYDVKKLEYKSLCHKGYTEKIIEKYDISNIHLADVVDYELRRRIYTARKNTGVRLTWYDSPNFLLTQNEVESEFKDKKFHFMASFYKKQRRRFNILLDENLKPTGGKWSFDDQNRKKLPKNINIPGPNKLEYDQDIFNDSKKKIKLFFDKNIGDLDGFNYPCNHESAKISFEYFLTNKLEYFGPYEDAISKTDSSLYHSVLTSYLNIGLINPKEIIELLLEYLQERSIPINSLEGFVRQIIGWREFIRGMYEVVGCKQRTTNFWNFNNRLPQSFYNFNTNIDPVDFVIKKSIDTAYAHHIERLMIIGNIFCLLRINPDEVYKWFMELFIDSYDWVMVPNVYGMSQFADGGLISTKPYISGSNYILKMSDYKKGYWSKIWDSLYWIFIHDNRNYFIKNPRMALMVKLYDKKPDELKQEYRRIINEINL